MIKNSLLGLPLISGFVFGLMSAPAFAEEEEKATWTGHVGLVSKYILRGITSTYGPSKQGGGNELADAPESHHPALQWGADWVHPSGIYLGYWASQINYSYKRLGQSYKNRSITDFQEEKSIENDLYGGYMGKIGDFGYTVGLAAYIYSNGERSDSGEAIFGINYGGLALNAQVMVKDALLGNKGDIYWTLNYTKDLPYKINLSASLGWYNYQKEGKYYGTVDTLTNTACAADSSFVVNSCLQGNRPSSGGFRHLILGVSQPIMDSGVSWSLQGIVGGHNRYGVQQDNRVIGYLTYTF